jgi:hypothetical protein
VNTAGWTALVQRSRESRVKRGKERGTAFKGVSLFLFDWFYRTRVPCQFETVQSEAAFHEAAQQAAFTGNGTPTALFIRGFPGILVRLRALSQATFAANAGQRNWIETTPPELTGLPGRHLLRCLNPDPSRRQNHRCIPALTQHFYHAVPMP